MSAFETKNHSKNPVPSCKVRGLEPQSLACGSPWGWRLVAWVAVFHPPRFDKQNLSRKVGLRFTIGVAARGLGLRCRFFTHHAMMSYPQKTSFLLIIPFRTEKITVNGSYNKISATMERRQNKPSYFPMNEVLESNSFFYGWRGGHAINHPGNKQLREFVNARRDDYTKLSRNKRGQFIKDLLKDDLRHVQFVISRDVVLNLMDQDDAKEQAVLDLMDQDDAKEQVSLMDQDDANEMRIIAPRKLGLPRRRSLMKAHGSIDKIRAYPTGCCIAVGDWWAADCLGHLFRDDGSAKQVYNLEPLPLSPCQSLDDMDLVAALSRIE